MSNSRSITASDGHRRMFVCGGAFTLRYFRMRRSVVVIAFFMLGDSLKMVIRGSDMARGGEVMLAARHLDF